MAARAVVVMGASGAGKTTIGVALAETLQWRFIEGDSFHPASNIDKMAAGHPLTDEDRAPWLAALAGALREAARSGENVVLACSALKESYRERLRVHDGVRFVFLDVPADILRERLAHRRGHFMPTTLVASQLETLEPPKDALRLDATRPVPDTVRAILSDLEAR
jgi:gluconokinase